MTAIAPCRTCGTQPREAARFCDGCGSPVKYADTRAEYKQVTVLYADVVHSMGIAASVGPERLREIMADLADRCASMVQRYSGTVDKFTGDGIMAVFGAPVALEDHAVRACLAALGIQEQIARLAGEVKDRDGIDLRLRVGLNSGQVIAGEIGSRSLGYTTVGEQVGMAQRMESVAPPGGIILSASTATLVEGAATLGEPEMLCVKGADEPVPVQRLLGFGERRHAVKRAESNLVGRRWELSAVEGLLDRAIDGQGAVVSLVGPPGIGKSRLVREVAATAGRRGVEVLTTFGESHTCQVPFHAVARLLHAATGVENLDGQSARDRVRDRVCDADAEDVLLLDDLLGIADPNTALPAIDPDARRRRLTALLNAACSARETATVYVVEDAHWIDEVSDSMIADFLTVIPHTPSLVLVTYRPEYHGALSRVAGGEAIALAPLSDPETAALVSQLLGQHPSVGRLATMIGERAAGNPFFAEEIVRELAERRVLRGNRGTYTSMVDVAEVSIPATVQATIAARIDRLDRTAKETLNAAAVIGYRFTPDLLTAVGIEPLVDELLEAELIDRRRLDQRLEYVFHHPLIRTVAYESQLKADRADLHRRVAAAIEACEPGLIDENALLIAEHFEAAGDLATAYAWHMRAGAWLTKRDFAAARLSWERATRLADALPTDAPQRTASRIAPRTMLCVTAWLVGGSADDTGFSELRALCADGDDERPMAMAMYGVLTPLTLQLRLQEASELASEQSQLFACSPDPVAMTGVISAAMFAKLHSGQIGDADRLAQRVIDLLDGDPTKAAVPGFGSPLAMAHLYRGLAGSCFGRPSWRRDFKRAMRIQRAVDPNPAAFVVPRTHGYAFGIFSGTIASDETTLRDTAETLHLAEQCGNDVGLALARVARGLALSLTPDADRDVCLELFGTGRDANLRQHNLLGAVVADVGLAQLSTEAGDFDSAIDTSRRTVDQLFGCGEALGLGAAVGALTDALLGRGVHGDIHEAETVVERLAAVPVEPGFMLYEVPLMRLRAILARARGDEVGYRYFADRYRALATSLGFEGHTKWAEAMP
ncbi:MAG TPA: adenylate/guanylate cyclase domain-containing protein [Mycobacterium sp.]|nr:adenylate/guanylate cyclase domain-containing protein [Mycobacterium sp.]HTX96903.1 adenylate/guanylate cyclase domain-containing protein [Mycobacterium sp.]